MMTIGEKEVFEKLKNFVPKLAKKAIRQGLRAAAKLVQKSAKSKAPKKSGALQKAIKVRSAKARKGQIGIKVGIGKYWFKGDEFYGGFQEFGWHLGRRKSRSRGASDARPFHEGQHFIEGAYADTKEAAKETIIQTIQKGIEEAAK
jgi:HK97 gp10 family phage protein